MSGLLKRMLGRSEIVRSGVGPRRSWRPDESADDFVELCFRLVLGRIPKDFERGEHRRILESGESRAAVRTAFVASPEFLLRQGDWRAQPPAEYGPDPVLDPVGSDEEFVDLCYRFLLDRGADDHGRAEYVAHLRGGRTRAWLVHTLATSTEFTDRLATLPVPGPVPIDVQLCELANPAKWDNPEWLEILRSYKVVADAKPAMHRKGYEFTQLAYGLERLGKLTAQARVLSVGAGHEAPAFWLANRVRSVIATDLYEGRWQSTGALEGDSRVVTRPEDFAPFPFRRDHLVFMRMNGRQLAFRDGAFDVVYSLSSIEHFGGVDGAAEAVREMARVLVRGGILALATEWAISGPPAHEVFTPDEVRRLLDVSNLRLIEPIDDGVWRRYEAQVVDLDRTPLKTPHMLVKHGDTVFTSVMVFLEKMS